MGLTSKVVRIENDDQDLVNIPMTTARTPIHQPNIVPPGYLYYNTGAFDLVDVPPDNTVATINGLTPAVDDTYTLTDAGTLTAGSLDVEAGDKVGYWAGAWHLVTVPSRGAGRQITLEQTGVGEVTIEGRMMEHTYILGGKYKGVSADPDDWLSMEVYCPASTPAVNGGATGNADLEAFGSINRFKPVSGTGGYDVDGADMEVGEINQGLCPHPNAANTGYWNWDPAASPSITPVDDPDTPDGKYDLLDTQTTIARQANRLPLTSGGIISPSSLKGKKILPHWVYKYTLRVNSQAGTVKANASMRMAREKTV